ncbi:MAG: endonuclease/exonuclease/phosphatase family protein [Alphaproteobacteria bacterium]
MILDWIAALVAICAALWTILPLFRHDAWWIRGFEFPRVQVTVLTAAVLSAYLAIAGWRDAEDWILITVLAACTAFQLIRIAPYTSLYPKQLRSAAAPEPRRTLAVMIANVLTPNRNAAALMRLVRVHNPDILLAVETDSWWESQLDGLESDYPHTVKHPLDNLYGMHLYSRLELIDPEVQFLVEEGVPSIHTEVRLGSGHRVKLHCIHPAPPSPTENETAAERDAELLVVANAITETTGPVVVMGDLNDVAWSASTRLFQKVSGLLDPRIGRGLYSTFHAGYPFLRWPLDHVFCSPDFTLVSLSRLGYIGSDHFPVLAVLHYEPGAEHEHAELKADAEDQDRVEQKIEKVDADDEVLTRRD